MELALLAILPILGALLIWVICIEKRLAGIEAGFEYMKEKLTECLRLLAERTP